MRRVSLAADELLGSLDAVKREEILANLNKDGGTGFIKKEEIEELLDSEKRNETMKVVVKRESPFKAPAKEYDPDIEIDYKRDVTGKSRTTGTVDDFIKHFQNRFSRVIGLFPYQSSGYVHSTIEDLNKENSEGQKVSAYAMVFDKLDTKAGNVMLIAEDPTGFIRIIISSKNEKVFDKSAQIVKDDILCFHGTMKNKFLIIDDFDFPDMQKKEGMKASERDLAIAYISDIHFGSRQFLKEPFDKFSRWINGEESEGKSSDLAGKIKYVVVAGDIVDGIGVYPNQEKDLEIKDIYLQYRMFDDFVNGLPDYVEVLAIPGNHDAVRRGEPMPAIPNDLLSSRCHKLSNPSFAKIEGISHLVYHGTSFDSVIASVPKLNYREPEKVMVELLRRRHLSPFYGRNPIVPEAVDYLVIDTEPDVFHAGHIHKNGIGKYRGTLLINSGTFQAQTDYQVKQGHIPSPGQVYVYEPKLGKINRVDFA
jgi:DNA polymerase II small subunit